jgi:hypothetical protein
MDRFTLEAFKREEVDYRSLFRWNSWPPDVRLELQMLLTPLVVQAGQGT